MSTAKPTVRAEVLDENGNVLTSFGGNLVPLGEHSQFASGDFESGDSCVVFLHPETDQGTFGLLRVTNPANDEVVEGTFRHEIGKPVDTSVVLRKPVFAFEPNASFVVHITTSETLLF